MKCRVLNAAACIRRSAAFPVPSRPEIVPGPVIVEFHDGQKSAATGFSPSISVTSCRYNSANSLYTFLCTACVEVWGCVPLVKIMPLRKLGSLCGALLVLWQSVQLWQTAVGCLTSRNSFGVGRRLPPVCGRCTCCLERVRNDR